MSFVSQELIYRRARIYVELMLFHNGSPDGGLPPSLRDDYFDAIREIERSWLAGGEDFEHCVSKPIPRSNCFEVYNYNDKIVMYLKAVRDIEGRADSRGGVSFLCPVRIDEGFVTAAYLVNGVLSEFDNDWRYIIDGSEDDRRVLAAEVIDLGQLKSVDPLHAAADLRRLQSFIWSCWTQWGPSVPVCETDKWTGVTPPRSFAIQFGYGDENNSLPVRLASGSDTAGWRTSL